MCVKENLWNIDNIFDENKMIKTSKNIQYCKNLRSTFKLGKRASLCRVEGKSNVCPFLHLESAGPFFLELSLFHHIASTGACSIGWMCAKRMHKYQPCKGAACKYCSRNDWKWQTCGWSSSGFDVGWELHPLSCFEWIYLSKSLQKYSNIWVLTTILQSTFVRMPSQKFKL